ncbi:hypothetical protein L596_021719 [Steinernema carpocapsae]|uniref:Peptidase A2 domain-containing protein n=1 Tax=Steinernema carpocapsae TaxID=34508 RepID=A0A4U5MJK5_STECR|nr:hypothetical protein L596_021719 [Steinernema carpocapsae]
MSINAQLRDANSPVDNIMIWREMFRKFAKRTCDAAMQNWDPDENDVTALLERLQVVIKAELRKESLYHGSTATSAGSNRGNTTNGTRGGAPQASQRSPNAGGTANPQQPREPSQQQSFRGNSLGQQCNRAVQPNARTNQVAQKSNQNGDSSKGYVPTRVLTVSDQLCRGLADTGAMTSVLSQGMWSRLDPRPGSLVPCNEVCLGANGLPLKILGECSFPVEFEHVRLPSVLFRIAADSFGHDLIIGTGLMDDLGFELYNRNTSQHMSLPSLSEPLRFRHKNAPSSPVRILKTTGIRAHGAAEIEVDFDCKSGGLYVLEPPATLHADWRPPSALVLTQSSDKIMWTIQNTSHQAMVLEQNMDIGSASEVAEVIGEREGPELHAAVHHILTQQADDDSELPFTMGEYTDPFPASEKRLEELKSQVLKQFGNLDEGQIHEILDLIQKVLRDFCHRRS